MPKKILVADDSLTIQKVVSITMVNSPFELTPCQSEKELFLKLKKENFDLLLLDFNLADGRPGYDLVRQVKETNPKIPVLVMLGTFDSVNDQALKECGVSEKIIKPFDGQKFIDICKRLTGLVESDDEQSDDEVDETETETDDNEKESEVDFNEKHLTEDKKLEGFPIKNSNNDIEVGAEESEEKQHSGEAEENEGWFVSNEQMSTSGHDELDGFSQTKQENFQTLKSEVEGWGMSVPGIINLNEKKKAVDYGPELVPPQFEKKEIKIAEKEIKLEVTQATDGFAYPSNDDLSFPDLETFSRNSFKGDDHVGSPIEELKEVKLKSKLVPLSELNIDDDTDDDSENSADETRPNFQMSDVKSELESELELKNEINSEISPDEFWAVDDQSTVKTSISIDEMTIQQAPEPARHAEAETKTFNTDEVVEKVRASIMPVIEKSIKEAMEELVKKYCHQTVERVAWEVIPDLAENIIKKEIEEISKQV